MKSGIEEYCKSAFQTFLEEIIGYHDIEWEDVDQVNEPPDYLLRLDKEQYAVEVTTLLEQIEFGNKKFSSATITSSLFGLVNNVESIARNNNILFGAYVVIFRGPIINFSRFRAKIKEDLLAYVETTQLFESSPEQIVFHNAHQQISIIKSHNQKNYIGTIEMGSMKWEGEAADEICILLEERIRIKSNKLKDSVFPNILLLHDAYHFADISLFQACLNKITNLSDFHTLFLVQKDKPGIVLYSENPAWLDSFIV